MNEAQGLSILDALIARAGDPATIASTFQALMKVHRQTFQPPAPPAAKKKRRRRRSPGLAAAEPLAVHAPDEPPSELPAAPVPLPDPLPPPVDKPAPTARPKPGRPPSPVPAVAASLRPSAIQGPLPRVALKAQSLPTPTPTVAPRPLVDLPAAEHARLTRYGKVLCASCVHGQRMEGAELGYACADRADLCVPVAFGRRFQQK